jgi:hypothetical protein
MVYEDSNECRLPVWPEGHKKSHAREGSHLFLSRKFAIDGDIRSVVTVSPYRLSQHLRSLDKNSVSETDNILSLHLYVPDTMGPSTPHIQHVPRALSPGGTASEE